MSTTLGDAPLSSSVEPTAPAGGATWRAALRWAAIGQLAMAGYMVAITAAFEGRFDPMPVVIGAIVGVGVWRLGRPGSGRGAVVYAGIVSLLLLLMVLAFGGLAVLLRPESTLELILFGGLLVFSVLGLVAAPGAFARRPSSRASTVAPRVAVAVLAALAVVGVVAGTLTGSATRMAGDVEVTTENFDFDRTELEVDAGRVAVFLDNEDVASHDFTIKDVVQLDVAGKKAGRAAFDIEPGEYRFYCSLHPDMEGMLRAS